MLKSIQQSFTQYKTPILYSGGAITKSIVQMFVGFVIAKYVAPEDLGLWGTLSLAISYAAFLQAGLISGLNRELPYAYGKGREDEARIMAGTSQTLTFGASIIIMLVGFVYALFFNADDPKMKYGVIGTTVFIAITFYQNYLLSTYRSKSSFLKLSSIQVINAFVNLVTIIFVIYYSYYGMIVKAVLVLAVYTLQLHIARPINVGLLWNKKAFFKLMATGLPLFALAYMESLSSTADKLWLLKYAGLKSVGYYTFAFYSYSMFVMFSSTIASYIYPRMTYNYGQNDDKRLLWKYVKKTTILLFLIQLPLALAGIYLIPILIARLFPNYIQSSTAMQILLVAGVLRGCVIGANAMMSIKAWKQIILYQVTFSILLVLLPFVGIKLLADDVVGVSLGLLLANFVNFVFGTFLTYIATNKKQSVLVNQ